MSIEKLSDEALDLAAGGTAPKEDAAADERRCKFSPTGVHVYEAEPAVRIGGPVPLSRKKTPYVCKYCGKSRKTDESGIKELFVEL